MLRKDYILWKVWIDISFFSYLLNLISLQSLLEEFTLLPSNLHFSYDWFFLLFKIYYSLERYSR